MSRSYQLLLLVLFLVTGTICQAQTIVKGKIIDAQTKEPLQGVSIHCTRQDCHCGCLTNAQGEFEMKCNDCTQLSVSSVGYLPTQLSVGSAPYLLALTPSTSQMQEVVVTANRGEKVKRSEAPVAITSINQKMIQDARPTMADQVLNKVSGVNMVNLGNEQHQMSIRQPMTTRSLFLYLEDGIPVRTTGLYNHNALLEMNMAATKSIEVIKGPSSSLYGSEAIGGVVNFITLAPTAVPVLKLSLQGSNMGYKRAELVSSLSAGKWGFALSGYYAGKKNGFLEYTDFHKGTFTARADYRFTNRTSLSNSLTYLDYYSDMAGAVDSLMFARRVFTNQQTFTYRKVNATRFRSTLSQQWNESSRTSITAAYRSNTIGQNPAYRIKDDHRKVNGMYTGKKDLAHGEINESSFRSYAFIAQHRQALEWKRAVLTAGVNLDHSPSAYRADYIRINKDTLASKYVSYQQKDSVLTHYATGLTNDAGFANFEFSPLEKLRIVASIRYDHFRYSFNNYLKPSAFSGSADTVNSFRRISPKVGFTYNFSRRTGVYANYSEGFVPPQVTELYTGVKVPRLDAPVFYNLEAGGWAEVLPGRLSADLSIYQLKGSNEIISVRQDDGSMVNQNAGRTLHRGVELGLNATPVKDVSLRISGAYSHHEFVEYREKGITYNGNEMNNAPNWLYNAEVWYKPSFLKGFRLGAELQHVGSYFVDPLNTAKYEGYDALNLRAGYSLKGWDLWVNVLNAANAYYSHITTRSSFGYSYQVAEPRSFTVGLSYDLSQLFKKQ